jgi:DNA-binding CsgD family transcriptional regulator
MTGFTLQECGVAACLLDHMQSKEIARATGLSYCRVCQLVARLRKRFEANTRGHLALKLREYA